MSGISTSVAVNDGLSTAFRTMADSINICLSGFVKMQEATGQGVNVSNVNEMRSALNNMTVAAGQVSNEITEAGNKQQQFNNQVKNGGTAMQGLVGKVTGLIGAYASLQGIKGIVSLSDTMTQTTARLNLMNDGLQTTEELQQKIFQSAQNSRALYTDTAASVAKLGNNAKDAFSSNDEIVKFSELINKQFTIAGASTIESSNAFLQLTQAMGSGVLRGEELNSIFEQAPNIIQTIAEYLNVPIGKIREMAKEGEISSDVVKAAVFSATDEINEKFASMPMTWGQVFNSMQNKAIFVFQPILNKINEIANNEKFQNMANSIVNSLAAISTAGTHVFDVLGSLASLLYDNWSAISPLIWGVAAATGFYYGILAIGAITQGAAAFAMSAYHIACAVGAFMVGNLTIAQTELNLAMLANPILFVVSLIIGVLIIALVKWIKSVGDLKLAWLIAMDTVKTATENLQEKFMMAWYGILNMLDTAKISFLLAGNLISDYVGNMKVNVLTALQNMINGSILLINNFIKKLNKIPGVNIDAITTVSTIGTDAAATEAKKQAERIADFNKAYGETQKKAANRASELANLEAKNNINQAKRQNEIAQRKNDIANGTSDEAANSNAIASNTAATADDTGKIADAMEITEEDLKYLRDIAEREIIDRTVFQSLTVDMGGVSNTVNNMTDLDGIGEYLGDVITQAASASMEG